MEYLPVTIKSLEIIKAALEGDIIRQRQSPNAERKEWKKWLADSEKELKKVTLKIHALEAKRFERDEE